MQKSMHKTKTDKAIILEEYERLTKNGNDKLQAMIQIRTKHGFPKPSINRVVNEFLNAQKPKG